MEETQEALELLSAEEDRILFADEAYRHYLRFLSIIAEKLIRDDIRERTQIDDEITTIAMLNALVQNPDMEKNLPTFTALIKAFVENYLHLAISKKRKSRAEIIEAVKSAFRTIEEKSKRSFFEKLLKE
jgi:TRAP-type uncharacterized transport system substrate-binding protein